MLFNQASKGRDVLTDGIKHSPPIALDGDWGKPEAQGGRYNVNLLTHPVGEAHMKYKYMNKCDVKHSKYKYQAQHKV